MPRGLRFMPWSRPTNSQRSRFLCSCLKLSVCYLCGEACFHLFNPLNPLLGAKRKRKTPASTWIWFSALCVCVREHVHSAELHVPFQLSIRVICLCCMGVCLHAVWILAVPSEHHGNISHLCFIFEMTFNDVCKPRSFSSYVQYYFMSAPCWFEAQSKALWLLVSSCPCQTCVIPANVAHEPCRNLA